MGCNESKPAKGGGMAGNAGFSMDQTDLEEMSQDDRMAVMRMVAEGELSVEEAVAKVKQNTADKQALRRGDRRGAVKKAFRGRLQLNLKVRNPAEETAVLVANVEAARDLLPVECNSHVEIELVPDPTGKGMQRSAMKENSKHPKYAESFEFELRPVDIDLERTRLVFTVKNTPHQYSEGDKIEVIGSLSFALAELFEVDDMDLGMYDTMVPVDDAEPGEIVAFEAGAEPDDGSSTKPVVGWFKVLDQKKGLQMHQIFKLKKKKGSVDKAPAAAEKGGGGTEKKKKKKKPKDGAAASDGGGGGGAKAKKSGTKKKKASAKGGKGEKLTADSFTFTKVLGRGSFGKVFLAEKSGCDEVFAVKALKKTAVVEDDDVAGTMTEKRVLELSEGNPFLTKLHATFHTDANLFFVMEFVNGGDLLYHIQARGNPGFKLVESRFYAAEILLGLWYLHEHGVLYRDLKLDNVMLSNTGHVKIADFGMCKEHIFGGARTTTYCGTPGYLAPEIVYEEAYDASVDFWSLGVLLHEFVVGESPFNDETDDILFDEICNKPIKFGKGIDKAAADFCGKLLARNPEDRIGCGPNGMRDVKAHPFFKPISWEKLAKLQIPPPWTPKIKNQKAAELFDDEFTSEYPRVSHQSEFEVSQIEQKEFKGFSFVNGTGALAAFTGGKKKKKAVNKKDLRQYDWYRPELARAAIATALKGQAAGTFCIRESRSQVGCYAISVAVGGEAQYTGLIRPSNGGAKYCLMSKFKFENIPDLVAHYCKESIPYGKATVTLGEAIAA